MKLTWWERFREWMGWHKPSDQMQFDGCSFESRCQYCGRKVLMDSQGNWFTIE